MKTQRNTDAQKNPIAIGPSIEEHFLTKVKGVQQDK